VPTSDALDVLLLPVAAPWLKLADAITYAREFPGATVLPIHDAILSDPGKQLTDTVLTAVLGADTYKAIPGGNDQPLAGIPQRSSLLCKVRPARAQRSENTRRLAERSEALI
jgi:hypothetical protein